MSSATSSSKFPISSGVKALATIHPSRFCKATLREPLDAEAISDRPFSLNSSGISLFCQSPVISITCFIAFIRSTVFKDLIG